MFVAGDDPDAIDEIEALVFELSSVKFYRIETPNEAETVHRQAPDLNSGVFYMKSGMGRGVDFRFAIPAYVLILNYDHVYRSSNITQMVGRSSREQGIQSGHVFCNNKVVLAEEPGMGYLEDKEKKVNADMGPNIAQALVRTWNTLNGDEKFELATHFKKNNWQAPKEKLDTLPLAKALRDKLAKEFNTK